MTTAFCISCRHTVKYTVNERDVEVVSPKGLIKYKELYAICNECGEEIYVAELNDKNVERNKIAYKNLINEKEIKDENKN